MIKWFVVSMLWFLCLTNGKILWDWETAPEWSFQVYLNDDVTLKCNDSESMLLDTDEIEYWKLPDRSKIHGRSIRFTQKHRLMYDQGLKGGALLVKDISPTDSGLYFCYVKRNNKLFAVNRAINLHGHLEKSHIKLYQNNLITGAGAASVFAFLLTFFCLLHKFKYRTPEEKQARKPPNQAVLNTNDVLQGPEAFQNEAFVDTQL